MKKRFATLGVAAVLLLSILPISSGLAVEEDIALTGQTQQIAMDRQAKAPVSPSALTVASASVDGFLSIDLKGSGIKQTASYRAPLTGYYSLCLSEEADDITLDISITDVTAGADVGSITMSGANMTSDPILYLVKGSDYKFTFSTTYSRGMTAALSLVRETANNPAQFTVEDGVLTGYSGKLVDIIIPEGVQSISDEGYADLASNIEGYYGSEGCYVTGTSLVFPASMTEVSAEQLNYENMGKDQVSAVAYSVADGSASFKAVDGALYSKDGTTLVAVPSLMRGSLTVPSGVKTIGPWAFAYGWLDKVTLPSTLVTVGESAFQNASISEVALPNSVKAIEDNAFSYVGWSGSSSLEKVTLGNSIETIGNWAFDGMKGETLVLPKSVKSVGMYAFSGCPNLTSVTIQSNAEFDRGAFSSCPNLKTLTINANVEYLDGGLFENDPKLTSFKVGDAATRFSVNGGNLIEKGTNYEGKQATIIALVPASSKAIDLAIPAGVNEVGSDALVNVADIKKLTIGKDCTYLGDATHGNLVSISVASGNQRYLVRDGVLYSYHYRGSNLDGDVYDTDEFDLVRFPMGSTKTELVIGDDVWSIWDYAFYNYSKEKPRTLIKVTIPEYVSLGYQVFGTDLEADDEYGEDEEDEEGAQSEKKLENALTITGYKNSDAYNYYQENKQEEFLGWKRLLHAYNITFNANGGKISSKTTNKVVVKEGECLAQLPKPTRSGYAFQGWYDDKTGGNKIDLKTTFEWDTTLYAHWKKGSCKVTFNGNGGTPTKKSLTVSSGAKIGKLPTASRKNYFFLGWFTAKSGGTQVTANTKVTKTQTLYAHWAKADLTKAVVTVKNATWTGKALKPAVTVKLKGSTLKVGAHFTLKYTNNKEPGKGKVTLTGKGVFAKSKKVTKSFTISKATQSITGIANKTYNAGKWKKNGTLTLKPKVKESAKLTYATSNAKVVKKDKSKNKFKFVAPGVATITVKAAATKHYKAATKKITVTLKASLKQAQDGITVGGALLKYDAKRKVYLLSSDVFQRSIGAKAQGGAAVTCTVAQSGAGNQPWFESGDKLTAKGTGDFKVLISAKATKAYPAATKTITVRMSGTKLLSNNYTYQQTSASDLTLLKYVGSSSSATVPNTYEFQTTVKPKKVSKMGDGVFAKSKVKSVYFTDGSITSIGKNAFADCVTLEKVRLPIGLTSLGSGAFKGCAKLSDIVLPDKVKELGASAFEGCTGIRGTFYLPNSLTTVGGRAFFDCGFRNLVVYSYLKTVAANAFNGCAALTDVYYSASRDRWTKIGIATGNEPLVKATKHYNAAGPTTAYSVSNITDEALYRDYPTYLANPSYKSVCNDLEDDFTEVIYNMSDLDISLAALKEQMASGGITYTFKALIQVLANTEAYMDDGFTWEEKKLQKALALELIQEVSEGSNAVEVRDQLVADLKSIKGVADKFESAGDKVLKDESTMTTFASALADVTPYSSADVYAMLSTIEEHWDQNEDKTRSWTIKGIYGTVGESIDAVDFVCTVVIMNEYYRENINIIMSLLPQDSGLYMGIKQLDSMVNHGLETYVKEFLQKKAVEKMAKYASKLVFDKLIGVSKGVLSAASAYYEIMSYAIDAPSIDSLNKAWLSTSNALLLHNTMTELNSTIASADAADRPSFMKDHQLVCSMYFASLKAMGKYVIAVQENKSAYEVPVAKDPVYMTQKLNRYSPSLSYAAYIRSCKELVVEG